MRKLTTRELGEIHVSYRHFSRRWAIERPDHIEKSCLTGPGRPHDGKILSPEYLKVDIAQGVHGRTAKVKFLVQPLAPLYVWTLFRRM